MGPASLVVAVAAALALLVPSAGMYLAMGTGGLAIVLGWRALGRADLPGQSRLCGAGAMTLGALVSLVAIAEYALGLAAISALADAL